MKFQLMIALLALGLTGALHAEESGDQGGGRPPFDQAQGQGQSQQGQGQGQAPEGQGGGQHQGGRHHGPPPEALAACKGKTAGTACSFTGRRSETVSGTCWSPDTSKPLGCKPAGGPPPM